MCSAPGGGIGLAPEPAEGSGSGGPTTASGTYSGCGAGDVPASNGAAAAAQSPARPPDGAAGCNAGSASAVRDAAASVDPPSCPAGGAGSRGACDLPDSNGGGAAGALRSSCPGVARDSGKLPGDAQHPAPGSDVEAAARVSVASSDGDSDLEADVAADAARRQLVRWRAARRSSSAGCNPVAGPSAGAACLGAAPRAAPSADAGRSGDARSGSGDTAAAAVVFGIQDTAARAGSMTRGAADDNARTAADTGVQATAGAPLACSRRRAGGTLERDSSTEATWGTWTWADPARVSPEAGRATNSMSGADGPGGAPAELGGVCQGVHGASGYPRHADGLGPHGAEPAPGSPAAAANALNSTLMSALIHGQGAPALAGTAMASSEPVLQAATPAPTPPCRSPGKGAGPTAQVASTVSSEAGTSAVADPDPNPAIGSGDGQEAGGRAAPRAAANPKAARLKPSAKAVCAVWELLEACIAKPGTASSPSPGAHQ